MLLHYCPQCGSKLQSGFKFCPSCGEKLPCQVDANDSAVCNANTQSLYPDSKQAFPLVSGQDIPALGDAATSCQYGRVDTEIPQQVSTESTGCSMLTRTPIKNKRRSTAKRVSIVSTPPKLYTDQKPTSSPQKRKASPEVKEKEEQKTVMSPSQTFPGKGKRAKRVFGVEPVQEGLELCDQSGKKWKLRRLLCQTEVELTYEVEQSSARSTQTDCGHILRMGAKDGQLFNEQNFFQRAAKSVAVEKWMKKLSMDFLGIPSCIGFGLHETYRFLIFPDMGPTLQSIIDKEKEPLSERAVLQLALRLLDALEFIHENEYAHSDIHAGNLYLFTSNGHSKVFLSGFGHAFRFCPGGKHVEYREGSRTPHQGNLQFISIDSHKGAGSSCRSDLQSLAYCLLFWMTGTLPWSDHVQSGSHISTEKERYKTDTSGLISYCFKKKKVSGALECYLSQVMAIHYTEKPNYSLLKSGLNDSLDKMGGVLGEPLIFR